ncbi:MAG TPA: ATP-binding protein [Stellaceae bacterium]|nr:ATP-binding protein [Stellaceae bacterium]
MALMHIPLEGLTEAHLNGVIAADAAESMYIEYKRETYGGKDADRREFLGDVSSFANTRGGDLLIGVEASNGIPAALSPFQGDHDAELLRLDNMARTALEPRIPNLQMRAVPIAAGGSVLVIRAARSFRLPHRVIFGGLNRFYARSAAGKYEPNVDELRALFVAAPELADRMRGFRFDRAATIAARDAPVPLQSDCCLMLHVVPFSHFDLSPALSMDCVVQRRLYLPPPGTTHAHQSRPNFDGYLSLSNPNDAGQYRAYMQVFRAGAIEGADSSIIRRDGIVDIRELDLSIVRDTRVYAQLLHDCGAEPPYTVMASVLGVREHKLAAFNSTTYSFHGQLADREQLHLAETVIEKVPADDTECASALRPMLDQLANAAGRVASVSFDAKGDWQPG